MPITKLQHTIEMLKQGWMTSLVCASAGGVLSLSQRIGDLRKMEVLSVDDPWHKSYVARFEIAEKWVDLPSGSRVKAWKITKERKGA